MCGGDEPETRRLVGLAGDLSRSMPDAITLLVTSAETSWMKLPERMVLVEVPGDEGAHGAALRALLVDELAADFRPDVIVVDPGSTELLPRLDADLSPPVVLAGRGVDVPAVAASCVSAA